MEEVYSSNHYDAHYASALHTDEYLEGEPADGAAQDIDVDGDDDQKLPPRHAEPDHNGGMKLRDRTSRLRTDIGSRIRALDAGRPKRRAADNSFAPPQPQERVEWGLVSDFMTSVTRYGKHALLYVPSRVYQGHIYRLFAGGGSTAAKQLYYKCCHCWSRSNHTLRPSVVIRRSDGMIVSDPDRPRQPHICTDFAKYPMFTAPDMYAEQIFMAAMEEVRSGVAADTTMNMLISAALDSVQIHVPEEHRDATAQVLHKFKKTKRSAFLHARRSAKLAMALQAATEDGGNSESLQLPAQWPPDSTLQTTQPQLQQQQQQQHDQNMTITADDVVTVHEPINTVADGAANHSGMAVPTSTNAVSVPLPRIRSGVSTIVLGTDECNEEQKDDSESGERPRRRRVPKRKFDYDHQQHGANQTQFATFTAGNGFFDTNMRRALQQELVRHERRIFMIKERKAVDAAKYAQLVNQREFQHRENIYHKELDATERKNAADLEHMRECNELARRRMQLENDMMEIKKQLMLKQLHSADAPVVDNATDVASGSASPQQEPQNVAGARAKLERFDDEPGHKRLKRSSKLNTPE